MFLSVAIHLIKFLKTKGEEIEGISILEKNEKKTEVRRIGEKSEETTNKGCIEPKKQEKKIVKQPSVDETRRKIQEDRRRRVREDVRFRVKTVITEKTEIVLQKEGSEEIKVLNVKTMEDKSIKTNDNQKEFLNFQKLNLNNTEKRTERDKALQNILNIKKDQTKEKLKLDEMEKENFKDKNNAITKAPGLEEDDQNEQKRRCDESDQIKGKKRKADAEENRNKNELTKEGKIETCDQEEYDNKCEVEDGSKSLMVSMTCAC